MYTDRKQLVAACQRKEPQAMKQLYDELAPAMLGVCMRYTRSRDEAQDLLHDGFIKAYEGIGKLQDASALESWMTQIMVNLSLDYIRRGNNLCYCDIEAMYDEGARVDDEELDLDDKSAVVQEVVEAMQSLPGGYRAAFNMRAVESMDYDEIARLLRKSESTVRSYVARAKQMILEIINSKGNNYE